MEHSGNNKQRIIVIGASTGGFQALKLIVQQLPPGLDASIFIVWHMSPNVRSMLPSVLNNVHTIYAAHAVDEEEIKPNRIYVAQPDFHLLIEEGRVRVTRGPKENRFRPAIDPLFRSAAHAYGNRVIGIILTGALDDGTAGLCKVKNSGGIAIVQDPCDAEVPSMPASALREVNVDYCVPASAIAGLIARLSQEEVPERTSVINDERTETEIDFAGEDGAPGLKMLSLNELSPFSCPDCHGVLAKIMAGSNAYFGCHTGHSLSADTLLSAITGKIEDSLYNAIRGIDESILLLNHIGDHMAELNAPKLAAMYFQKSKEAQLRAEIIRNAVLTNEHLSNDRISSQPGDQ